MNRRKKLLIRQSHAFPYAYNIGYWGKNSGYPDRDFLCVSLKDFQSFDEAQPELEKMLKEKSKEYC